MLLIAELRRLRDEEPGGGSCSGLVAESRGAAPAGPNARPPRGSLGEARSVLQLTGGDAKALAPLRSAAVPSRGHRPASPPSAAEKRTLPPGTASPLRLCGARCPGRAAGLPHGRGHLCACLQRRPAPRRGLCGLLRARRVRVSGEPQPDEPALPSSAVLPGTSDVIGFRSQLSFISAGAPQGRPRGLTSRGPHSWSRLEPLALSCALVSNRARSLSRAFHHQGAPRTAPGATRPGEVAAPDCPQRILGSSARVKGCEGHVPSPSHGVTAAPAEGKAGPVRRGHAAPLSLLGALP